MSMNRFKRSFIERFIEHYLNSTIFVIRDFDLRLQRSDKLKLS